MIDDRRHILQQIAKACGLQAALDLAEWKGGIAVYVPYVVDAEHEISRQLGAKPARWLQEHCGGEYLKVPAARDYWRRKRNEELLRRLGDGETAARLAQEYKLDIRSVWRIKAERDSLPAESKQSALF